MERNGYPVAAMVLGIVMGTMVEQAFVTSLIKSDGSILPFFSRPVAADRLARWYREAAAHGVAAAQNNLGLMHAQGRGVPRDIAGAQHPRQRVFVDHFAAGGVHQHGVRLQPL